MSWVPLPREWVLKYYYKMLSEEGSQLPLRCIETYKTCTNSLHYTTLYYWRQTGGARDWCRPQMYMQMITPRCVMIQIPLFIPFSRNKRISLLPPIVVRVIHMIHRLPWVPWQTLSSIHKCSSQGKAQKLGHIFALHCRQQHCTLYLETSRTNVASTRTSLKKMLK